MLQVQLKSPPSAHHVSDLEININFNEQKPIQSYVHDFDADPPGMKENLTKSVALHLLHEMTHEFYGERATDGPDLIDDNVQQFRELVQSFILSSDLD